MSGEILLLLLPAVFISLALPFGIRLRTEDRSVRAVYLFHESGDPLAMVAGDYLPPFPANQLEPLLDTIRDFIETSVPGARGFAVTSMRFGEEALVAVRGQHVSACAVFRGEGANAMRRDLLRFVREFEGQNYKHLTTWEEAARIAGSASDALSSLLSGTRNSSSTPAPRIAQPA